MPIKESKKRSMIQKKHDLRPIEKKETQGKQSAGVLIFENCKSKLRQKRAKILSMYRRKLVLQKGN